MKERENIQKFSVNPYKVTKLYFSNNVSPSTNYFPISLNNVIFSSLSKRKTQNIDNP